MSENNVHSTALSPEDAMLTHRDTPEAQVARAEIAHQVRGRIVLGAGKQKYASRSSIKLTWQDNGKWYEQEVPVRSLTPDQEKRIADHRPLERDDFPEIPRILQTYLDKDGNEQTIAVDDMDSREALVSALMMKQWSIDSSYERLLEALDIDLEAPDGSGIVWSSMNPEEFNRDEAINALKALEIPDKQMAQHLLFINDLSIKSAQQDATDFLSESEQPSAPPDTSTTNGAKSKRRRRGQR